MNFYQLKDSSGEVLAEFQTETELPLGVAEVVEVSGPKGGGGPDPITP